MKTFLLSLLLFSLPLRADSLVIAQIQIEKEARVSEDQIRHLLTVQEGDPFSQREWEQSLSYLKKWGRFREVRGAEQRMSDGMHLRLILKEGYLLSAVTVSGSYPFLSSRIRRLIAMQPGDLYDSEQVDQQVHKIQDFYQRQGFEGTEVEVLSHRNEKKGTVDIEYKIHKGTRFRIGRISVTGNTVFPRGWFITKINPLATYEPSRIRNSLEKIRKGYQQVGFLKARVRITDLTHDPSSRKVHLALEVDEGYHVAVRFKGNRRVSDRSLKKVIPIFTEGGYGSFEIEESEKSILRLYQARGFLEATVSSEKQTRGPGKLGILFIIQEGPATQVKRIKIEGNQEVSDRKIKRGLLTHEETLFRNAPFHPETPEQDDRNLPQILNSGGALEAKAIGHQTSFSPLRDKATVTFQVVEGPITRLAKIQMEGNSAFPEKKLRKKLKLRVGQPLGEERLAQDKESLAHYYADRGYPYVLVSHRLQNEAGTTLTYTIDEGKLVRIGEILIIGNEKTREASIRSALLLKKNDPFSYRKVVESETSLRRLGAFRSVNIETIGLAERESVVHLKVKIEESEPIILDLESTFDTDNQFTGSATINHVNLFGFAKRANLKLTGGRDIQKGEVNLIDSHLLGHNFEGILSGLLEQEQRPGFDDVDGGGSVSLLRELTPRTNLFGRYQIVRTFFRNVVDPTEESEQNHTTSKFSLSSSYDSRDSFADPSRGIVALVGIDFSNKIAASSFDFIQPKGYFANYWSFGGRWTLLNFVRAEGIQVFGDDVLTRDQRLFLGGDYTVRGFEQDRLGPIGADGRPTGGQLLLMHTFELQTRVFKNFKTALFLDSGSLTSTLSDVSVASWRHSSGVGLRYITPVGPLRLDYGFKLDRQAGENLSRLHFSFGYAF